MDRRSFLKYLAIVPFFPFLKKVGGDKALEKPVVTGGWKELATPIKPGALHVYQDRLFICSDEHPGVLYWQDLK